MSKLLRDAYMVHPSNPRVSTTAGHTIQFVPNKEVFVPALAVPECMKHGAKPTKFIKGTETPRLNAADGAGVKSEVYYPASFDEQEVEVVSRSDIEALASDDPEPKPNTRNTVPYTEGEAIVRRAILDLMQKGDPSAFTDTYLPKISEINNLIDGRNIRAEHRDRVWGKLLKNGEVTEGMIDEIFGEEELEDDNSDSAS